MLERWFITNTWLHGLILQMPSVSYSPGVRVERLRELRPIQYPMRSIYALKAGTISRAYRSTRFITLGSAMHVLYPSPPEDLGIGVRR